MKKMFLVLPLIILMVAGIVFLNKRRQAVREAPLTRPTSHPVRIVAPETRTVTSSRFFLAKLESKETVNISSTLSGKITDIFVDESLVVKKGDPLLRIDECQIQTTIKGLKAQLDSAEIQLDFSRTQHERNRILFEAGGLAREKFEASRVTLSKTEASVKELQQKIKGFENQLQYTRIKAPFNGTIGTIYLHRGDLATPGRPLLSLNSLSRKLTFAFVPQKDTVHSGQSVKFPEYPSLTGRITKIYADTIKGLSIAEIEPNGSINLPNGSNINVSVLTKTASGCSVPVQALLHRVNATSVMCWQNSHFSEKTIHILTRDKFFAVIEPCVKGMVAVASEAKLSLLPTYDHIKVNSGENDE